MRTLVYFASGRDKPEYQEYLSPPKLDGKDKKGSDK